MAAMNNMRSLHRPTRGVSAVCFRQLLNVGILLPFAMAAGCRQEVAAPPVVQTLVRELKPEQEALVEQFCASCHLLPGPATFPQEAWPAEVRQAFDFYKASGRRDLDVPSVDDCVAYFRRSAPETLEIPRTSIPDWPGSLDRIAVPAAGKTPSTAGLTWGELVAGEPPVLVFCDMRSGEVGWVDPREPQRRGTITKLLNPCRVRICDLDRDGNNDLLVSELGSFMPADHDRGEVVWLRQSAEGKWSTVVLARKLGRVCDIAPVDIDQDGDLDLAVAEFGWHKTGSLLLLENAGFPAGKAEFKRRTIDKRPGAIDVQVSEVNGDGRPDLVVLIGQEYETIEAYINDGAGGFERQTISPAEDPSYGSSSIQLVDIDGDGDDDVLYTNGDGFDSAYLKPFHGIQWLENRGEFPYTKHRLADMAGSHRAVLIDLDRDGDQDIVAAGFLPKKRSAPTTDLPSVLCLEQIAPGKFESRVLERGRFEHPALLAADFDGDGFAELAVPVFRFEPGDESLQLEFWRSVSAAGR